MRALTTILMLCLPMAAMGETYVCTTDIQAQHLLPDVTIYRASERSLVNWVIDLDSGYRSVSRDEYEGECKMDTYQRGIRCSNTYEGTGFEDFAFQSVVRDLISLEFSITSQQWGQDNRADTNVWFGTCTKL